MVTRSFGLTKLNNNKIQAWSAMKDLLGGEERIHKDSAVWSDAFIVNLGAPQWEGDDKYIAPADLDNWHVDGDFFVSMAISVADIKYLITAARFII